jgi:hypothetical protein
MSHQSPRTSCKPQRITTQANFTAPVQSFPKEIRKIMKRLESVSDELSEGFDRGARLFQVALVSGRAFPSVAVAYRVAAVEAIAQSTMKNGSFATFMKLHTQAQPDLVETLDFMYNRARSAHFHGGQFPFGEFDRVQMFDPLLDSDEYARGDMHSRATSLFREAIGNWILTWIS